MRARRIKGRATLNDQPAGPSGTITGFREWMAVSVVLSGGMMLALVVSAMSPIAAKAAAYFAKSGNGDMVTQMIVTTPAVGIIIGGPVCGWLIALLGAKRFFLIALGLFGLAGSAGLYLDDASTLLVSRFLLGLATSGIVTAMITMIGAFYTPQVRARILGYQSATGALAGVAIIFGAGQLGELAGWRAPFGLYLLAFPVLALGALYLPTTERPAKRSKQSAPTDYSALINLWPIYLMIIPMFIAVYMPNIQVSFLLRDDGVTNAMTQSYVILTGAATVALAAWQFGPLQRWLGNNTILLLCFVFQGAGIALMGLTHGPIWTALGCAILGIGTGISNPVIGDLIVSRTAPDIRSLAIGASYTARYSGDFINPLVVHPLGVAFGLHRAFVVVGSLFLAGVAIAAAIRQNGKGRRPAEVRN